MHDVRVYAFYSKNGQWYRLIQDDDGRIAYLKVEADAMRKGDLRIGIPEHASLAGINGAA